MMTPATFLLRDREFITDAPAFEVDTEAASVYQHHAASLNRNTLRFVNKPLGECEFAGKATARTLDQIATHIAVLAVTRSRSERAGQQSSLGHVDRPSWRRGERVQTLFDAPIVIPGLPGFSTTVSATRGAGLLPCPPGGPLTGQFVEDSDDRQPPKLAC
jgi:hypothetical protein